MSKANRTCFGRFQGGKKALTSEAQGLEDQIGRLRCDLVTPESPEILDYFHFHIRGSRA